MSLGLRLELRQSQGLVLTPQLQQAIRLLQLSNLDLAGAVDRECAENPFLQRLAEGAQARAGSPPAEAEAPLGGLPPLLPAADRRPGRGRSSGRAFDGEAGAIEDRLARPTDLRDHVRRQVGIAVAQPEIRLLATLLADEIEDDGYLREADSALADRFGVEAALLAEARRALQRVAPAGVGARDLAECLLLQLAERDRVDPPMRTLLAHLPLLARADLGALMKLCRVDAEDLQAMIAEVKALDPRPGRAFGGEPVPAAIPDLFVYAVGGAWRIELNSATLPKVLVDSAYAADLCGRPLPRREREYVGERLQSANWLVKALDQRARTILKVAKAIFARQLGFLAGGAQRLRPLVLRDIAGATGLHESTVSRATSDKYVATPWGTLPLKYFFTTAIAAVSGEESHSAEAIRQQLKRLVEREDPASVLSDDQIVLALEKSGVAIARRTVAKYRESLGIPSSVQRRRAKALGR